MGEPITPSPRKATFIIASVWPPEKPYELDELDELDELNELNELNGSTDLPNSRTRWA